MRERLELSLPVRVQCRETLEREWVEMSRLLDVTPFGARFIITRPTERGRLLHLTLPMPRQLRCFDHVEQQYRIWALVRNVKSIKPEGETRQRYEVGVAFIGKRPPASFEKDPTRRYDVAATPGEAGLWALHEMAEGEAQARAPSRDDRVDTRHQMALDVTVEVMDADGEVEMKEVTVTENISRRGAAVFTTLQVDRGRFVRLTSSQYNISVIAAVRGRRLGMDGIPRLHLEFIDRQWPLEGAE